MRPPPPLLPVTFPFVRCSCLCTHTRPYVWVRNRKKNEKKKKKNKQIILSNTFVSCFDWCWLLENIKLFRKLKHQFSKFHSRMRIFEKGHKFFMTDTKTTNYKRQLCGVTEIIFICIKFLL